MKNTENKGPVVTGIFSNRQEVEHAYDQLHQMGYTKDDVDVVMTDETRKTHFAKGKSEIGNKALEGTGTGSVIGGTIGAVAAAIAAIGTSIVIPGLGLIVAGPIAAAIAGAGAGSVAGGLVGALVGAGLTEERARIYEKDVKSGKILMTIHTKSVEDAKEIEAEWHVGHTEEVSF